MSEPSKNNNHEKAVRAAVEGFSRAFLEADVETLEKILTNDYVHINGRSGTVLDRNEWLTWMQTRGKEMENRELQISEYRVEDLTVKIYENAAIVTGVVVSSGTQKGDPFSSRVRFTNTWILVEGMWYRAAFHDSPLSNSEN